MQTTAAGQMNPAAFSQLVVKVGEMGKALLELAEFALEIKIDGNLEETPKG